MFGHRCAGATIVLLGGEWLLVWVPSQVVKHMHHSAAITAMHRNGGGVHCCILVMGGWERSTAEQLVFCNYMMVNDCCGLVQVDHWFRWCFARGQ